MTVKVLCRSHSLHLGINRAAEWQREHELINSRCKCKDLWSHVHSGGDIQPRSVQVLFTCLSDSEEERTRRKTETTTTTTGSDETAADQNITDETKRFMFDCETDRQSNYRLCVVTPVHWWTHFFFCSFNCPVLWRYFLSVLLLYNVNKSCCWNKVCLLWVQFSHRPQGGSKSTFIFTYREFVQYQHFYRSVQYNDNSALYRWYLITEWMDI